MSSTIKKILDVLKDGTIKTRNDIVRATGLPRTTVYDNIMRLCKEYGFNIEKVPLITGGRGRPRVGYVWADKNKDEILGKIIEVGISPPDKNL